MVTTNRMVGTDGHIPILDDIYDQSSTQKCSLGTRMAWADGRIYRYFQCGGTGIAAGMVMQTPVLVTGWDNSVLPGAAWVAGQTLLGATASAGTSVIDTNIEVTACVDGFLGIRSGAGQGYQYQIKGHTAISSNSAFTMYLYDPIKVAVGATASCCLIRNPYKDLIIAPTTQTGTTMGVTTIATTADYFGWAQTWGVGLGMSGTVPVVQPGAVVVRSAGTAGYITGPTSVGNATLIEVIARGIGTGVADQYVPVIWTISP